MICAWGGMSEGLVVTDLILSSSMRTKALVQSLPRASQSLPNFTAFMDFGAYGVCAAEMAGRIVKDNAIKVRKIFIE